MAMKAVKFLTMVDGSRRVSEMRAKIFDGEEQNHDGCPSVDNVSRRTAPQTNGRGENYDDRGCGGCSTLENEGENRRIEHRNERSWRENDFPCGLSRSDFRFPLLLLRISDFKASLLLLRTSEFRVPLLLLRISETTSNIRRFLERPTSSFSRVSLSKALKTSSTRTRYPMILE